MLKKGRRTQTKGRLWRALANPVRRRILDKLSDGPRTTSELAAACPNLSRFAVMQHLGVLSDAKLVLFRREGRKRFNYINSVPLAEMYERWVSRYAAPAAHASLALKRFVERNPQEGDPSMSATAEAQARQTSRVVKIESEITIAAPIQRVFDALTIDMDKWWQLRVRKDSRIIVEPHVGGRMFEDWGGGRGAMYGSIMQWDPPASFCTAGANGWSGALFVTWHRLESVGSDRTIIRKSMQFIGDVSDDFVSMMEQGNRAIMEKQLKDFVERGTGRPI